MEGARYHAVKSLLRMEKCGRYSNIELDAAIAKSGLDGAEKALYTKLFYGVTEKRNLIDLVIASACSRKVGEIDEEALAIIRTAVYQIFFLDRIPTSAAVNEAVGLADEMCPRAKGFVNAVLRKAAKKDISVLLGEAEKTMDAASFISVKYSVSEDVAKLITEQYGKETAETIFENSTARGVTVRANTLKTDAEALAEKLSGKVSPICRDCVTIEKLDARGDGLFERGEYIVQSAPSALCASLLLAKPGDLVIDACACPGGKTFSAAFSMNNEGRIIACDIHENKLSLITKNAKRLGIDIIETVCADAKKPFARWEGAADAVLCDVPCSGLGSVSEKPDIRYKSAEDFERLPEIQFEILQNCSRYVKRGGVLVYSTCTLNKNENSGVAEKFLSENAQFVPFAPVLPDALEVVRDAAGACILPCKACGEGFYIARFTRK